MKKILIAMVALCAVTAFAQESKVHIVRVETPKRNPIAQVIRQTGGLFAPATVELCAKVPGRLTTLQLDNGTQIEEGVRVKKGERIGTIDEREYKAQLEAAKAGLVSATVTVADKKRENERMKQLFSDGAATEQERDQAAADFERAQAAELASQAELHIAELNLAETVLVAPFDGVISVRHVVAGSLLVAGAKVVTITQTNPIRFQTNIPTSRFSLVKEGETELGLIIDAYPGEVVNAKVTRVFPVANDETRTVRIEAELANDTNKYLPGMYATADIALNKRENVLTIPYDAIVRLLGDSLVYRVVDGKAECVKVKTGIRSDAIIEIVDGLSDDDTIITVGQQRLTDGSLVKPEYAK